MKITSGLFLPVPPIHRIRCEYALLFTNECRTLCPSRNPIIVLRPRLVNHPCGCQLPATGLRSRRYVNVVQARNRLMSREIQLYFAHARPATIRNPTRFSLATRTVLNDSSRRAGYLLLSTPIYRPRRSDQAKVARLKSAYPDYSAISQLIALDLSSGAAANTPPVGYWGER